MGGRPACSQSPAIPRAPRSTGTLPPAPPHQQPEGDTADKAGSATTPGKASHNAAYRLPTSPPAGCERPPGHRARGPAAGCHFAAGTAALTWAGREDGSRREPGGGRRCGRRAGGRQGASGPREALGAPGIASPPGRQCYEPSGVGNDTEGMGHGGSALWRPR